jgi:hypothetical protein
MRTHHIVMAASLALFSQLGHAANDDALGLVSLICIEQSEESKLTPVGQQIMADQDYQKRRSAMSDAAVKCMLDKKIVSADLCAAVISNDPETRTESPDKLIAQIKSLDKTLLDADAQCGKAK